LLEPTAKSCTKSPSSRRAGSSGTTYAKRGTWGVCARTTRSALRTTRARTRATGTQRGRRATAASTSPSSRESVILAGYSFDHARDVLAPLHQAMQVHHADTRFFVDLPQVEHGDDMGAHV